ncbi:unnamed protein product, partial [Pelagomonas calceolata]
RNYFYFRRPHSGLDDRELEDDLLVRELLVDVAEGVELRLDVDLVLRVEQHLQHLGAVQLAPRALADDLRRVDQIVEDGVLDRRQRAAPRPRALRLRAPRVVLAQDRPLAHHNHVPPRELLLELADEPRLDLVVFFQLGEGHEDDDGLLAAADVDLARAQERELPELDLDLGRALLQILQLRGHGGLDLRRLAAVGFDALRHGGRRGPAGGTEFEREPRRTDAARAVVSTASATSVGGPERQRMSSGGAFAVPMRCCRAIGLAR